MVRPLPCRVDPVAGEAWPGYTHRVAAYYGIDYVSLMRPLSDDPLWLNRLRRTQSTRLSGIAVLAGTRDQFAAYFNLTPGEVTAMHLNSYDGFAVDLPEADVSEYDPLMCPPTANRALPASTGWLHQPGKPQRCTACVAESPQRQDLSWWLKLHLVCPAHGCYLSQTTQTAPYSDPQGMTAQAGLLRSVRGEQVLVHLNARQTYRQVQAVIESLAVVRHDVRASAVLHLPRHDLMVLLRDAWDAISRPLGTGPSAHLEELLATPQGRMTLTRALARHDCDDSGVAQVVRGASFMRLPDATHEANTFAPVSAPRRAERDVIGRLPDLMPLHLYDGPLSDVLHELPSPVGRIAARVAAAMYLTRRPLDQFRSAPSGAPGHPNRHLTRVWEQLQAQGRDSNFWDATQQAAELLITEHIDYRHREHLVLHGPLAADLAEDTALEVDVVRVWLSHQWACCAQLLDPNLPAWAARSRPGYALRIDSKHGWALSAALPARSPEAATA